MYTKSLYFVLCFFFNDTAHNEIYTDRHTLALHDALPISALHASVGRYCPARRLPLLQHREQLHPGHPSTNSKHWRERRGPGPVACGHRRLATSVPLRRDARGGHGTERASYRLTHLNPWP